MYQEASPDNVREPQAPESDFGDDQEPVEFGDTEARSSSATQKAR
jgi:hypothetical protein